MPSGFDSRVDPAIQSIETPWIFWITASMGGHDDGLADMSPDKRKRFAG
jgi:hypothetical protein